MREKFHIHTTLDSETAVRKGQVIVLAVKPQVLPVVYADLRGKIKVNALVISIIAGTTIESIAAGLEHRAIVRTMPNTPGQVGEGMTVWTATPEVSDSQRDQAEAVVEALGHQLYVDDENFLDMATAVSGSGPSYVFLFMESLIDATVHLGFSRADALYQLEKGGFRTVVSKAVLAAYQRSVALRKLSTQQINTSKSSRTTSRKTSYWSSGCLGSLDREPST